MKCESEVETMFEVETKLAGVVMPLDDVASEQVTT